MNPTRLSRALLLALALSLALSGCELSAAGDAEQIANLETIQAGTPSPTSTPTITPTLPPTATHTATVGPSPTATDTPVPTSTPLPPTPTANPALTGFSLCRQQAGASVGRFSAALGQVSASGFPAYEQITLPFSLAPDSGPIGASATCLSADDVISAGLSDTPVSYTLRVDLPGWIRDERFAQAISGTLSFSTTRTIVDARLVANPDSEAGASLLLGLREPLPFRISVERNPARLVVAVARQSPLVSTSDQLSIPAGGGRPALAEPLFALFDGDIWRVEAGAADAEGIAAAAAGAVNLTDSPETETDIAVSPDGQTVAFCRAAPGLDPADSGLPVPSALWTIGADGDGARLLAQVGVSCADPAFSPDGATVVFAVDETGAEPSQRTIYTVPAAGGAARPLVEGGDEWSRFAPQWLANNALVYAAAAQDGRSTLFLRRASGEVLDLGETILVDGNGAARYGALGEPLASRDGARFAVEAFRADSPGADLVLLAADGSITQIIGAERVVPPPPTPTATAAPSATRTARPTSTPTAGTPEATEEAGTPTATATAATPTVAATLEPEPEPEPTRQGPYWTRPLAWDAEGRLLYLATLCASDVVQDYQLYRWGGSGAGELLAAGQRLGGVGAAAVSGSGLAYALVDAPSGARGPLAHNARSPLSLWLWDLASGARGELLSAERGVGALE